MSRPGEHPPIPNLPTGSPQMSRASRQASGASFTRAGGDYHAVRPGYPAWVTGFFLHGAAGEEQTDVPAEPGSGRRASGPITALDLGAGTGLYTRDLVAAGLQVTALEPSDSMRAVLAQELPQVALSSATAEDTGLDSSSFDLVTVAQAWHWMDRDAASAEIVRLLRTGGVLGLVWNQLDVTVPWVHRLARIMHSGDVQRDPATAAAVGPGFGPAQVRQQRWSDTVTPEKIVALCHSRSYWLKSSEAIRSKVDANLTWYLHEHLGHAPGEALRLPYDTLAVRYVLA
ncbi:MAG: class I SAM-dependent methyltransferase [Galactobacter sp.]|uniref:class I SAM-dependent methyltransferase n=1 Tax=Galactobacter sp. TaxID=2676125 RepID=UPI0025C22997|nr:class I SAM-dependent methyltransferase [Galactobacter sp.]